MDCKTLLNFAANYDANKYPFGLYNDLVINGNASPRKFELMGAWKTGAIRIKKGGREYLDSFGNQYEFTKRWAAHTPVGYGIWKKMDNPKLCINPPDILSSQQPDLILKLMNKPGFGFIWALFVAHICRPEIYPLYDQHVWRAYRYMSSEGAECPISAPNKWSEFIKYSEFFQEYRLKCKVPYWVLDQALWVYGKSLKKMYCDRPDLKRRLQTSSIPAISDKYVHSLTLGRSKAFWWFIDENCDIHIGRSFRNGVTNKTIVKAKIIVGLFKYLSDKKKFPEGKFPLANNVEKLKNGNELPGIGKYLHQNKFSTTEAQVAGHLAEIFYSAGIWNYNKKKKGQLYCFIDDSTNWCEKVKAHYAYLLESDD